ncbi:MAG: hypothetical protein SCI25_06610 [Desulfuromonadales bacterium]|nr:hypothetical protein [Desulfuromonadales bacterium]MDW7756910.1 hypothetical protein [Desulfuromonadales bacterium]
MKEHYPIQLRDAWILFFILGLVMINYPFIHIFNKETTLFGIPLLILYLLVGWPASIAVVYFFTRTLKTGHNGAPTQSEDEKDAR